MNYLQKNFIYLSQIIDVPVVDMATNKKIGRVLDLVAGLREMYPRVSAVIVRRKRKSDSYYIPWKNVTRVIEGRAIFVENISEVMGQNMKVSDNEILLKDTFWDKQIVDIVGSKVVRVNDLHLLREDLNLWVVHMDVGIRGLFRRLGLERFFDATMRLLFSYEAKDRLISWKFVQPITTSIGSDALSLKVHHSRLSELHPADLADIVADLGTDERITILNSLDNETAAHTFQELPLKIRTQVAGSLNNEKLLNIVQGMATDEIVDLIAQLQKKRAHWILNRLPAERAEQITNLLQISEGGAGSIMNTEFIAVRQSDTAGSVLTRIKGESKKKESIYYVYVTDDNDALIGVVTLRQLLVNLPEKPVVEFMRKRVAKVRVDTNINDVAEIFYKYDFTVVPVVDTRNKMQGIITMKDAFECVFDEIREEAEETK
jgi:CBS domain-containing protein